MRFNRVWRVLEVWATKIIIGFLIPERFHPPIELSFLQLGEKTDRQNHTASFLSTSVLVGFFDGQRWKGFGSEPKLEYSDRLEPWKKKKFSQDI